MSKLGGAIADGAQLIEQLYLSFYQELQKPLLASSDTTAGSDMHTHGQTGQAADLPVRNGAVAKVAHFPSMLPSCTCFPMCFLAFCHKPLLCFSCVHMYLQPKFYDLLIPSANACVKERLDGMRQAGQTTQTWWW